MKIAIINNGLSAGGLRFEASLVRGLRTVRPDWQISYFTDMSSFTEDTIKQELASYHVAMHDYRNLDIQLNIPDYTKDSQFSEHLYLSSFDALIFTWPYDFCCPDIEVPVLFIPHDFNFFYFFEAITFSAPHVQCIRENLADFFARATPVVSTQFIKNEALIFFPEQAAKTHVVPVSAMSNLPEISPAAQAAIIRKFGLKPLYFLYPCSSVKPYKNLGVLAVAIYHLQQRGIDAQIVYIGSGTDQINGAATINGVRQNMQDSASNNVRGLGFVSDEELVALMRGAQAVATSSLYEAANGPAIDAWSCGVPVVMSDLPFYTEHIAASGVRATLFDPKNASSVAEAFAYIINNRQQVLADAAYSKEQMQKTTSLAAFSLGYAQLIESLAHE